MKHIATYFGRILDRDGVPLYELSTFMCDALVAAWRTCIADGLATATIETTPLYPTGPLDDAADPPWTSDPRD